MLTTLYRPVGKKELDLIRESGFRTFPPRLPYQPFFYPVLSESYARKMAQEWNTKDESSGNEGYVLLFTVQTEFLSNYERHAVGDASHVEYWIPAGHLSQFNSSIVGTIEVIAEFHGKGGDVA